MSQRTVRFAVADMSCANCAQTVGDGIAALSGVVDVDVNYATDEGTVTYDPEAVSMGDVFGAIEDAGYTPVTETATIAITDMSCANCAETNAEALASVPGVVDVDVNYATDEARVAFNPEATSRADLYDAIEDAGYTPVREDDEADGGDTRELARRAEIRHQRRLTLFGAALAAPLLVFLVEKVLLGGGLLPETVFGVEFGWVEFLLATPVQAVLGWPFYRNSYTALVKNRRANMDVLIALGSSTAYLYSV
ncbi:MAG: copper ion binding protein, partial [Halobacteriales archaeon]